MQSLGNIGNLQRGKARGFLETAVFTLFFVCLFVFVPVHVPSSAVYSTWYYACIAQHTCTCRHTITLKIYLHTYIYIHSQLHTHLLSVFNFLWSSRGLICWTDLCCQFYSKMLCIMHCCAQFLIIPHLSTLLFECKELYNPMTTDT